LRLYSYDAETDTTTLIVESTDVPADILITDLDLDAVLDTPPDYRLQIGLTASDPDAVTLEWFSGEPQDYNDFADALEIDPVYGSNVLSLMNNTLEAGETAPSGVESTGWMFFTAEEDQNLNFDISADLAEPYTIQVFSGTALGSLTLVDTVESLAGEDVIFFVTMAADTTYYLQFSALDDFINFDVQWYIDPSIEDPYTETEAGDTDTLEDPDYDDVEVDPDATYDPGYDTSSPDEESEFE
jgi:hypothetical protein